MSDGNAFRTWHPYPPESVASDEVFGGFLDEQRARKSEAGFCRTCQDQRAANGYIVKSSA